MKNYILVNPLLNEQELSDMFPRSAASKTADTKKVPPPPEDAEKTTAQKVYKHEQFKDVGNGSLFLKGAALVAKILNAKLKKDKAAEEQARLELELVEEEFKYRTDKGVEGAAEQFNKLKEQLERLTDEKVAAASVKIFEETEIKSKLTDEEKEELANLLVTNEKKAEDWQNRYKFADPLLSREGDDKLSKDDVLYKNLMNLDNNFKEARDEINKKFKLVDKGTGGEFGISVDTDLGLLGVLLQVAEKGAVRTAADRLIDYFSGGERKEDGTVDWTSVGEKGKKDAQGNKDSFETLAASVFALYRGYSSYLKAYDDAMFDVRVGRNLKRSNILKRKLLGDETVVAASDKKLFRGPMIGKGSKESWKNFYENIKSKPGTATARAFGQFMRILLKGSDITIGVGKLGDALGNFAGRREFQKILRDGAEIDAEVTAISDAFDALNPDKPPENMSASEVRNTKRELLAAKKRLLAAKAKLEEVDEKVKQTAPDVDVENADRQAKKAAKEAVEDMSSGQLQKIAATIIDDSDIQIEFDGDFVSVEELRKQAEKVNNQVKVEFDPQNKANRALRGTVTRMLGGKRIDLDEQQDNSDDNLAQDFEANIDKLVNKAEQAQKKLVSDAIYNDLVSIYSMVDLTKGYTSFLSTLIDSRIKSIVALEKLIQNRGKAKPAPAGQQTSPDAPATAAPQTQTPVSESKIRISKSKLIDLISQQVKEQTQTIEVDKAQLIALVAEEAQKQINRKK